MSHSDNRFSARRELIFKTNDTSDRAPLLQSSGKDETHNDADYEWLVQGQGVLIFRVKEEFLDKAPFPTASVFFHTQDRKDGLRLSLSLNKLELYRKEEGGYRLIADSNVHKGLVNNRYAFYWVSFHSISREFRFGIGEARLETMTFSYEFLPESERKLLGQITHYELTTELERMRILRDPIIGEVPLIVKNMDELTMDAITKNQVMPKANLSVIGQKLYENVAGKNFVLDDETFPEFSQAIEYSIRTKGCCCYNIIEKKRKPKEPNRVYLRITMGRNGGESPGSPYVFEIWPPSSYSPQHNHAGANALIRVLSGEISVLLYPYLTAEKEFAVSRFSKGDITWIGPTQNQFHVLKNPSETTSCITIQCYMYDQDDSGHYGFFDFVDGEEVKQFDPTSDVDFARFKEKVKKEWDDRDKS